MGEQRQSRGWFRGRSYLLGAQLDTFLVCAASGVVINRAILIVLGYPQIGSRKPGGIHISHSIYGGFAMMIALTFAIAFLGPATRWLVAIVGGFGFGWYVDELGKYVSKSLKLASLGTLDDRRRHDALRRLERLGPHDSVFADRVHELLADAPSSPPAPPGRVRRARTALRARYTAWTHRPSFTVVIDVFFFVLAIGTLGEFLGIELIGPGIRKSSARIAVIAAAVAAVLIVIGITRLRRNRLVAYRWFDRALLIRILVVQVFLFQEEQFAATLGLFVDLFVWAMLRSAIAIEEQRREVELDEAAGSPTAPSAAPTGEAPAEAAGPDVRS